MSGTAMQHEGRRWRYCPPDPLPPAARYQAILSADLFDEVLDAPFTGKASARTLLPHAAARVSGNLAGIAGRPAHLFAGSGIATAALDLLIEANGFLPLEIASTPGPQPGFPDTFVPRDLGRLALHRVPVALFGRVVDAAGAGIVGADVRISGLWPTLTSTGGAAAAPDVMPTPAGLYANRSTAATVQRRNFSPAVERKVIAVPINRGDTSVLLSDRIAIAAGDVLLVDPDTAQREIVTIDTLETGSSADQPALATLAFPLARPHAAGIEAVRGVSGAGGAMNALARAGRRGDRTAWTGGLSGIGPATTSIEISGGGPAVSEYHHSSLYATETVTDGAFSLPPIHRVAAVEITASHASLAAPIARQVDLAFGVFRQRVDLVVQ